MPAKQKSALSKALQNDQLDGSEFEAAGEIFTSMQDNMDLITKSDDLASRVCGICNVVGTAAALIPHPYGKAIGGVCGAVSMVSSFFVKKVDVPSPFEIINQNIINGTKDIKNHIDRVESNLSRQLKDMEDNIRADIEKVLDEIKQEKANNLSKQMDDIKAHLELSAEWMFSKGRLAGEEPLSNPKITQLGNHLSDGDKMLVELKYLIEKHLKWYLQDPVNFDASQNILITLYCTLAVFQMTLYYLLTMQLRQLKRKQDRNRNISYHHDAERIYHSTINVMQKTLLQMLELESHNASWEYHSSWSCLRDLCVKKFAKAVRFETSKDEDDVYELTGICTTTKEATYEMWANFTLEEDGSIRGSLRRGTDTDNDGTKMATKEYRHLDSEYAEFLKELENYNDVFKSILYSGAGNLISFMSTCCGDIITGHFDRDGKTLEFNTTVFGIRYDYKGTFDASNTISGTWTASDRDLSVFDINLDPDFFDGAPETMRPKYEEEWAAGLQRLKKQFTAATAQKGTFVVNVSRNSSDIIYQVKQLR